MKHDMRNSKHDPRLNRAAGRRRGSVLILVVAMLVLMMLLGTAFIQSTRFDRAAASEINTSTNIEQVRDAEIARIGTFLVNDLVDPNGGFLADYASTITPFRENNEPYDMAHEDVDAWLAASYLNRNDRWPHITDLTLGDNALWVGTTTATGTNGVNDVPLAIFNKLTTTIDPTGPIDADGDGITDSRFIVGAISHIGGVKYVSAIRVVDLSANLNINVATSLVDDTGAYVDLDAPRWMFPSELDLGRFMLEATNNNATVVSELKELLARRFGQTPVTLPIAWNPDLSQTESRYTFWVDGASMYGNFNGRTGATSKYQSLVIGDALRLLHANGLNTPDAQGTNLDLIQRFLRDDKSALTGVEPIFSDIGPVNVRYPGLLPWTAADPEDYIRNEPRHQMTTISGASEWAAQLPGEPHGRVLKFDVNRVGAADRTTDDLIKLRDIVEQVYRINPPAFMPGVTPFNGLDNSPEHFAAQFTANVADYIDEDNWLTKVDARGVTGPTGEHYGMEALPMISETFIQYDYEVTNATDNGDNTWAVILTKRGEAGFIIEIRNPYRQPIKLTDVWIGDGSGSPVRLDSLLTTVTEIEPDKAVLIYHNTGTSSSNENPLTAQSLSIGAPADVVDVGEWNTSAFDGGGTISLYAADDTGAQLSWPYQQVDFHPDVVDGNSYNVANYPVTSGVGNDPSVAGNAGHWAYKHGSKIGGDGINMLLLADGDFATQENINTTTQHPTAYDDAIDKLGDAAKGTDLVDPLRHQFIVRDGKAPLDRLWQVNELTQVPVVALGPANQFADTLQLGGFGGGILNKFFLDIDTTSEFVESSATARSKRVPHAVMLIDRLSVLTPRYDKQNNDNDGKIDEDDEAFVPGRINLNTVPPELLERVLPIDSQSRRNRIVDKLTDYRDNPMSRTTKWREEPGIASIGELHAIGGLRDEFGSLGDSGDTHKIGTNAITVDFTTPDDGLTGDGIEDDREESVMLPRMLSGVCTTRSDIYAAYIYILGYPATADLKNDTVDPVEQLRVVVILDRSHVKNRGDKPRVLGMYRY